MAETVLVPDVNTAQQAVKKYLTGRDPQKIRVTPVEKNYFGWLVIVSKK